MTQTEKPIAPVPVDISRLPARGHRIKFTASAEERQKICQAFDLLALDELKAELLLERWHKNGIVLRGKIIASLGQSCVVSLAPVVQNIDQKFEIKLVPEGSPLARPKLDGEGEMLLDPEGEELPDTYAGETIDVAGIILENFLLLIDPFPRLPGVRVSGSFSNLAAEDHKPPSPFEILKQLKDG